MRKTKHQILTALPQPSLATNMNAAFFKSLFSTACILLVLLMSNQALAAKLTSNVNRNQIGLGETLVLQVSFDEQISSSELSYSGLETDFDILGVNPQSSSNVSIVNGKVTSVASTVWTLTLAPKRVGQLKIPAFSLGSARSQPIIIEVKKSAPAGSASQPLLVKISVDKNQAYVDEQILVRIEISAQNKVSNLNGAPLQIADTEIHALEQQNVQRIDNGIARQVITLNYLIYPKVAGKLKIPAQTYTGLIGSSRSVFDTFARRGQQIVARTEAVEIDIQAAQSAQDKTWFPAEEVSIKSAWSGDINNLTVGEPITRTIQITASGQRASVIPPLDQSQSALNNSYKIYLDQPQIENKATTKTMLGSRTEAQAIVPAESGEIQLPEQQVHWWNIKNSRWEVAVLPAETLKVQAASAANTLPDPALNQADAIMPNQTVKSLGQSAHWGWKLASLLLAALVLVLLVIIWRLKNPAADKFAKTTTGSQTELQAWRKLDQTLKSKNTTGVRSQLLDWAQVAVSNGGDLTLQNLSQHCANATLAERLDDELTKLDQSLYRDTVEYDPQNLSTVVREFRKLLQTGDLNKKRDLGKLQALYPE